MARVGGASGSPTVAAGLAVLGASGLVYLAVAARATGPAAFGDLTALWTVVYTVGIGCFLPFEQELGRALARRAVLGEGGRPVVLRAALAAGLLTLLLALAAVACAPALAGPLLSGDHGYLAVVLAASATMAAGHLTRGIFTGTAGTARGAGISGHAWYSGQLGAEGVVRTAACLALALLGCTAPMPYAWILTLAPAVAVALTVPGVRPALRPGPPAPWRELSANLSWLIAGSVCAQAVANVPVLAVTVLSGPADRESAGRFLAAVVLARVPVFAFQAVQAVLVPAWTRALTLGDRTLFRRELLRGLGAIAVLGVACAGVGGLAGPGLLRLTFGPRYGVGALDLVVLSLVGGCHMACLMFQAGIVALGLHRFSAAGWAAGLAAFGAGCLVPLPVVPRVESAMALSAAVIATLLGLRLRRAVTSAPRPTTARPARPERVSACSQPVLPRQGPALARSREKDARSPQESGARHQGRDGLSQG
ncbi:lipopolysaccharide biosynthesis protein [Streptosporangium sp. NPDC004631]